MGQRVTETHSWSGTCHEAGEHRRQRFRPRGRLAVAPVRQHGNPVAAGQARDEVGPVDRPAQAGEIRPAHAGHMVEGQHDVKARCTGLRIDGHHRPPRTGRCTAYRSREGRGTAPARGTHDRDHPWPPAHISHDLTVRPRHRVRSGQEVTLWTVGRASAGCGQPDDRCPDMRRPPSGGQRGPSGALAPGGRGQCATAQPRRGALPLSRLTHRNANFPGGVFTLLAISLSTYYRQVHENGQAPVDNREKFVSRSLIPRDDRPPHRPSQVRQWPPSRPTRTASAIRPPSAAARTDASALCRNHSATPSRVPVA